jgi:hypothetical protein
MAIDPELLIVARAGEMVQGHDGVCLSAVAARRWCSNGRNGVKLKHVYIGARYYTRCTWLEEFLATVVERRQIRPAGSGRKSAREAKRGRFCRRGRGPARLIIE